MSSPYRMPSAMARLESFPNPHPQRDYTVEHTCHEFTSVCPKTGQPDFGTIVITYVPDRLCVELRSLKLYLQDFRNQGIFYEDVINAILEELVRVTSPRRMTIEGRFTVRGGLSSVVTATHEAPPKRRTRKR